MSTHPGLQVPELSIGPPEGGGFPSNCPHSSPKPSYTILGVRAEARPPPPFLGLAAPSYSDSIKIPAKA